MSISENLRRAISAIRSRISVFNENDVSTVSRGLIDDKGDLVLDAAKENDPKKLFPEVLVQSDQHFIFLPNILALEGTNPLTDLEAIPTVNIEAGGSGQKLYAVVVNAELYFYRLDPTDQESAAPSFIRPSDFAETTNEKCWVRIILAP